MSENFIPEEGVKQLVATRAQKEREPVQEE
jgi:hypothetical protein